jgi:hypothetical protein
MRDARDFFQRHAESEVRLPRLVRVLLGVLVVLAAAGFVFLGAVLLPHRLQMPHPPHAIGTLLFGAFLVALGLGFGFIGMRLVLLKQHSEHLMSAHAVRMASYCSRGSLGNHIERLHRNRVHSNRFVRVAHGVLVSWHIKASQSKGAMSSNFRWNGQAVSTSAHLGLRALACRSPKR